MCLPPDYAYQMFNKFKLKTVEIDKITVKTEEEFFDKLKDIYQQVAESPVEKDGEGSVLYLVSEDKNTKV